MIKKTLINIKSNKFSKDVLITLTSNIAVGISGVLFNTIIGNLYSIYNLGIFNQALSAYLFLGIIANLGIRNAILKFCAETNNHYKHQKAILGSGLIIVLVSSILISSAIYLTTKQFPEILFNKEATSVFQYFIYSIPFFCLNKVFLFFFNAKRQMKTFSFYSFLRVFLSVLFVVIIAIFKLDFNLVFIAFLVSEILIFITLTIHIFAVIRIQFRVNKYWINKNLTFGIKSFFLDIVGQSNLYVDIFFVSIFLNSTAVGKYSLAISIVNGLLLLSSTVQLNFNPIISNLWSQSKHKELQESINKIKRQTKRLTLGLFSLAGILFPVYIIIFFGNQNTTEIIIIFYILLIGFITPSIYGFSGGLLTMANFLNSYIKIALISLLLNLVFSYCLISIFNLYGAALAISIFHNSLFFMLFYVTKKKMNISVFQRNTI